MLSLVPPRIEKEQIMSGCEELGLYLKHDLNDRLYLQERGFKKIEGLSDYSGLKGLWLDSNAIHTIENISHLKCETDPNPNPTSCEKFAALRQLQFLYLSHNGIREISGLENMYKLEVLDLSSNFISTIGDSLEDCRSLNTLLLSRNRLQSCDDIAGMLKCRKLAIVDLSHNKISLPDSDPYEMIMLLQPLRELRSLDLTANPTQGSWNHYREVHITTMPESLEVLDRKPITAAERLEAKETLKMKWFIEQTLWPLPEPAHTAPITALVRDCCAFHALSSKRSGQKYSLRGGVYHKNEELLEDEGEVRENTERSQQRGASTF